jgi:hypothetical protein
MMASYTEDHVGRILLGLFLFAALLLTTAVFFFANRPDDAWIGPQAEKAAQEALRQVTPQPANK